MRYLMWFSYNGTSFSGYQIQKKKRTVEEEIEKVLTKLNHNKSVKIYASGRTDAKVHAYVQTAHFDFEQWNVENMKKASQFFIGEHDFTSFTKTSKQYESTVRTIYEIKIEKKGDTLEIEFTGNGFLQYMVRNMVGFLIEVGEGKRKPIEVEEVLGKKDRKYAAFTANPEGLYLKNIEYKKEDGK